MTVRALFAGSLVGLPFLLCSAWANPVQDSILPSVERSLAVSADFGDSAVGFVFGEREPVIVAVVNGTLEVIPDPLSLGYRRIVDGSIVGAVSVATAAGSTPDSPEAVLYTDASGLYELRGTKNWTFGPPVLVEAVDWIEAIDLQVHTFGGMSTLFGIAADGSAVLRMEEQSGGGWTSASSIAPAGTIQDIAMLDWDQAPGGGLEIAILTSSWLTVYNDLARIIYATPVSTNASTADRIAGVKDRIAWSTFDANGDPVLRVVSTAGFETDLPLNVPLLLGSSGGQDLQVSGLASGDLDGDGCADLVIGDLATHRQVVFKGSDGAQTFSDATAGEDYTFLSLNPSDPGAPGFQNKAEPLVADMDQDGKADVVFFDDSPADLRVWSDLDFSAVQASTAPWLNPTGFATVGGGLDVATQQLTDACQFGTAPISDCTSTYLNFTLEIPSALSQQYGYVQFTIYEQVSETADLNPNRVYNGLHALSDWTASPVPANIPHYIVVDLQQNFLTWDPGYHLFLRYRLVNIDNVTDKNVIQSSAGRSAGLRMDSEAIDNEMFDQAMSHLDSLSSTGLNVGLDYGAVPDDIDAPPPPAGTPVLGGISHGAIFVDLAPPPPPPGQNLNPGAKAGPFAAVGFNMQGF